MIKKSDDGVWRLQWRRLAVGIGAMVLGAPRFRERWRERFVFWMSYDKCRQFRFLWFYFGWDGR